MKSLFSRFRSHNDPSSALSSNPSVQSSIPSSSRLAHQELSTLTHPLDLRSTTPIATIHSQESAGSSGRPQSELEPAEGGYANTLLAPPSDLRPWTEQNEVDDNTKQSLVNGGAGVPAAEGPVKKVTFRSPVPTQIETSPRDETYTPPPASLPEPSTAKRGRTSSFQSRRNGTSSPNKPSRPSPVLPSRPSGSRSTSRQSLPSVPTSRKTSNLYNPGQPNPIAGHQSPTKSTHSSLPSHDSLDAASTRSYLPPPNSWSEMAEEDLIANLGPRERTRQEVLWEIVSSEERYVQELIKLNETFCQHLLPASATSPSLSLFDLNSTLARTLSPNASPAPGSPAESFDHLPIAARYASPSLSHSPQPPSSARINAYHALTLGGPPHSGANRKASSNTLNASARAHQSLPPPPRSTSAGHHSINPRVSYHPGLGAGKLYKFGESSRIPSSSSASSFVPGKNHLPEDLEKVLLAVAGGILEGHIKLAAALRKRYENQYPLVRSLADVFTAHSYILREYATYVLHLEKALSQVDAALATFTQSMSRRSSRRLEDTDFGRLGKLLMALEELAAERGESGLVISLSKPFQRLLKYPLLFQNLLFNTDPSLKEYEATLNMVDEVEEIVRSIEDEKASSEEREKTRDVWARIEGLERDKLLMAPKPNRLLVGETSVSGVDGAQADPATKSKKSFRRLSDILKGSGQMSDLWIVRFSDVSLVCERTGLTHLPLSGVKSHSGRSDSLPEINGRSKYATAGKRSASIKARNLYRFIKVHEWHLRPKEATSEGVLLMSDVPRARASQDQTSSTSSPRAASDGLPPSLQNSPREATAVPLKGDGGPSPARSAQSRRDGDSETVVSDRLSVMSFAYKGSDQMRPNHRRTTRPLAPPSNTAARALQSRPGVERRMSAQSPNAANAKFAHRLRSTEEPLKGDATVKPFVKGRRSLPPAMLARSDHTGSPTFTASPALSPTDRNTPASNPSRNEPSRRSTNSEDSENAHPQGDDAEPRSTLPNVIHPGSRGIKGTAPPTLSGERGIAKRPSRQSLLGARIHPPLNRIGGGATTQGPVVPVGPSPNGRSVNASGSGAIGMSHSISKDSSMALWTSYRDGGMVGTPVKTGGGTGGSRGAGSGINGAQRHYGGRV